jgi:31-O-methyltransferase
LAADTRVIRLPNGLEVAALNGFETRFLYEEIFERRRYARCGITLSPGDVVFDVGANIGLASLFFSRWEPRIVLYAFEPASLAFRALEQNVTAHGLPVRAFRCALGASRSHRALTYLPAHSICSTFHPDLGPAEATMAHSLESVGSMTRGTARTLAHELFSTAESEDCVTVPFSQVIRDHAIREIALAKIDVEGDERAVLEGIDDTDWPRIGQITLEVHDEDTVAWVEERLRRFGFTITTTQDPALRGTPLWDVAGRRA